MGHHLKGPFTGEGQSIRNFKDPPDSKVTHCVLVVAGDGLLLLHLLASGLSLVQALGPLGLVDLDDLERASGQLEETAEAGALLFRLTRRWGLIVVGDLSLIVDKVGGGGLVGVITVVSVLVVRPPLVVPRLADPVLLDAGVAVVVSGPVGAGGREGGGAGDGRVEGVGRLLV